MIFDLGLPTRGNREEWPKYWQARINGFKELWNKHNQWIVENGAEPLRRKTRLINDSKYLNLYLYPEEIDYHFDRPNPPKWHRIDSFANHTEKLFKVPEKLKNLPGKLIYLSMGSFGCANLQLMTRVVGLLKNSPHRFIVSKGMSNSRHLLYL